MKPKDFDNPTKNFRIVFIISLKMNDLILTKTDKKTFLLHQKKSDFKPSFGVRNELTEAEERLSKNTGS